MWQRLAVLCLLGALFAQAVTAIPQLSLTADEPVYIGAGYAFLQSGDPRLAPSAQHPPLMQELVALPLLLQPGPQVSTLKGWDTAEMVHYAPAFVAWYGNTLDAATFTARMVVVFVTLLWGAFLFRWAADWAGPWGGIIALTLFVFDPNILAHATLATTDIGFSAFSFVALFAAMRLLRHPSWRYRLLAGVALGGSLGAKSSGFFTALVLATLLLLTPLIDRRRNKPLMRRVAEASLELAFIMLLGFLVLWTSYGFEMQPLADGQLPVPMATQWKVWREMRDHLTTGHTGYLMGEIRDTGWLVYYPLAFALKTPLITLVLLVIGLIAAAVAGPRRWLAQLPLWIYLGGYMVATLLSRVNIGYRFLLPILPFLFILISQIAHRVSHIMSQASRTTRFVARTVFYALSACYIINGVRLSPDYLTYFNLLAGGPLAGHRYLVDSNLDWGQSFTSLKAYLDEQKIEQVRLSYYTYTDPALYGIDYQPLAPSPGAPPVLPSRFDPPPGVYAISATTLQGVMVADPDTYDWFRHRKPVARPGTAMFVYQVDPHDKAPAWLAQCTSPVAPLSADAAMEGFGRSDLRTTYFDCTSAWVYPTGGESPGWYALFWDTAYSEDRFIQNRLAKSSLSYEQPLSGRLPAFVLYEQTSLITSPQFSADVPIKIGHLAFLGYTNPNPSPLHAGQTVEVDTWWRVDNLPGRPLSIMMHLAGPGVVPAIVGDGLGVPIEHWHVGDVIIQRHVLPLPPDAPPGEYQLLTGAYWIETLERWTVLSGDQSGADSIRLPPLKVQP